jgi:hypothetical protein
LSVDLRVEAERVSHLVRHYRRKEAFDFDRIDIVCVDPNVTDGGQRISRALLTNLRVCDHSMLPVDWSNRHKEKQIVVGFP